MSELHVIVREITEVYPHPNPECEKLEYIRIGGWPVIVGKQYGFKVGQPLVYFPPDSVVSEGLAIKLGILKYLQPVIAGDGVISGYRVRAARLMGEPSFGTIDHEFPSDWVVDQDVTELLGVTKYEPPPETVDLNADEPKATFFRYTDIVDIRDWARIVEEGEEVVFTEKLHGRNCRSGLIKDMIDGKEQYVFMGGSNEIRVRGLDHDGEPSMYWIPLRDERVRKMLFDLSQNQSDVILFSEVIGSGKIQDLSYGYQDGKKGYRAFDLMVNGKFIDFDQKMEVFRRYDIPTVPHLYRGPFSWKSMEEHTDGPTTLTDPAKLTTKFKGREGIVVAPVKERYDRRLTGESKRVIFKIISVDFIARKNGTEYH